MDNQRLKELAGIVTEGKKFRSADDMLRELMKDLQRTLHTDLDDDKKIEAIEDTLLDYKNAKVVK